MTIVNLANDNLAKLIVIHCTVVVAGALLALGCHTNPQAARRSPGDAAGGSAVPAVEVVARAGSIRQYPCNQCHDKISAPIAPHVDAPGHHRLEPRHFDGADQCHVCHAASDMNSLAMINGQTVSFDEAFLLCGQCHSDKRKDFEIGAHGKVVGSWSGTRHRLSCTHCHDPHKPALGTTEAMPPPPFPKRGIRKGQH